MNIPVANIYYLMLYAWNVLDEDDLADVHDVDFTSLVDLFARVLHTGTDRLLRRGLDRGYVDQHEVLPGLRGRIDLAETIRKSTLCSARLACVHDELDHDLLHNQILRTTIQKLLLNSELSSEMHGCLGETFSRLKGISEIRITDRSFRAIQLHRNNRGYRFLLNICKILHESKLLSSEESDVSFRSFVEDKIKMRKLFERFVRNFYHREQQEFRVCKNGLEWVQTRKPSADHEPYLPKMRTDTRLRSASRSILIETKFMPQMFQEYHGKKKLRTSHLYQLYTYLRNLSSQGGCYNRVEGILLYPATTANFDLEYEFHEHRFRVCTVDLKATHRDIRDRLLGLLAERSKSVAAAPIVTAAALL